MITKDTFERVLSDLPGGHELADHLCNAECCENINDLAANIECALEEINTLKEQLTELWGRALKLKKAGEKWGFE